MAAERGEVYESNRRSVCDVWEKEFPSLFKLQAHCRVHTGDKPYKCEICGKAFSQSSHLGPHKRVHSDVRPFGCSTCGKSFVQAVHLQVHAKMHSGERLFCCKVCGEVFRTEWNLDRHYRFHAGDKPCKCGVCGKRFGEKVSLKRHMRAHSKEEAVAADRTEAGFVEGGNVVSHGGKTAVEVCLAGQPAVTELINPRREEEIVRLKQAFGDVAVETVGVRDDLLLKKGVDIATKCKKCRMSLRVEAYLERLYSFDVDFSFGKNAVPLCGRCYEHPDVHGYESF